MSLFFTVHRRHTHTHTGTHNVTHLKHIKRCAGPAEGAEGAEGSWIGSRRIQDPPPTGDGNGDGAGAALAVEREALGSVGWVNGLKVHQNVHKSHWLNSRGPGFFEACQVFQVFRNRRGSSKLCDSPEGILGIITTILFYFILFIFRLLFAFFPSFFQHVCVRVHVCVPRLDGFTCRTTTLALACEIKLFVGSRKMKINFCLPALVVFPGRLCVWGFCTVGPIKCCYHSD